MAWFKQAGRQAVPSGPQLVKKFKKFYGRQRVITTFTRDHPLSLTWAKSIQSIPPVPLVEDTF
jgi:hypothetical protein